MWIIKLMCCRYFDGNHCPSLIGKPKVFIIQVSSILSPPPPSSITIIIFIVKACRGAKFDYGVSVESTDGPSPPVKMDTEEEVLVYISFDLSTNTRIHRA